MHLYAILPVTAAFWNTACMLAFYGVCVASGQAYVFWRGIYWPASKSVPLWNIIGDVLHIYTRDSQEYRQLFYLESENFFLS